MAKVAVADAVKVDEIAAITPGFTGADLANLVNEAAILATRRGGSEVTMDDFTGAVERIVAGAERRSRLLKPEERARVAYHEMGHALAASALETTDPVHKVSIIPRSIGALGYTMQRPTEDRFSSPPTNSGSGWWCSWPAAPRKRSSSGRFRQAPPTTSPRPRISRARASRVSAWTRG
jgi:cell division protease FtsH